MKSLGYKLLVVDDDLNNRSTLARRLIQRGYAVDTAEDGAGALGMIGRERYDLVLLDQMMPGMSGIELLRLLRATYSQGELPVIMVTGVDENQALVEALNQGANDYVVKPVDIAAVAARVHSQLERSKAEHAIRMIDPVTGLGNRSWLLQRITAFQNAPDQDKTSLSVLCLGLDGFKAINDSLGHPVGDRVLHQVAARLNATVREFGPRIRNFAIARIGNDEFVVLLNSVSVEDAGQVADAILASLPHWILLHDADVMLGASIGITSGPQPGETPEEVLRDANLAMRVAKESGRNRWRIFDPSLRFRAQAQWSTALDLRDALRRDELVLVYQPEINLAAGVVVGFEALVRWQHPSRGWLGPAEFISIAEETGLIIPLGAWVIERACNQLRDWQRRFPNSAPLTMSVNLSVAQLADPDLLNHIRSTLEKTGVFPGTLKLELTESLLMPQLESAKSVLSNLQALQVGLKLDDFGTGYSSLSYLPTMNFDSLKIDRSFVAKLGADPESHAIVKMIIGLAHGLGMSVVGEGIENSSQLDELVRLGCDTGQGYLLARPLTADGIEKWFASESGLELSTGRQDESRD